MPKQLKHKKEKPKAKMGRPTVYREDYPEKAIAYGAGSATDLAIHFNVTRETIWGWSKEYPDFFNALQKCLSLREQNIIAGALSNQYNAGFAKFLLSAQHGIVEKTEQDINLKAKIELVPEFSDD